jgi:hypothetical protein
LAPIVDVALLLALFAALAAVAFVRNASEPEEPIRKPVIER